jgi:outer membrane protein TolC
LGSDWYVGLKASKPWLGNTGSYSFAENKTSPKLGQSTRTEGTSHSLEFGILNNLTGYSEKQSALIGKLKAENELIEMEKTINTEVREAYNNYQKAVMQIKNTSEKIAFREEEVKVLQAQAEINEALSSQVLEAMVKLSDEKALYHQAIASYKTALANLNKAIGIIGYFD